MIFNDVYLIIIISIIFLIVVHFIQIFLIINLKSMFIEKMKKINDFYKNSFIICNDPQKQRSLIRERIRIPDLATLIYSIYGTGLFFLFISLGSNIFIKIFNNFEQVDKIKSQINRNSLSYIILILGAVIYPISYIEVLLNQQAKFIIDKLKHDQKKEDVIYLSSLSNEKIKYKKQYILSIMTLICFSISQWFGSILCK